MDFVLCLIKHWRQWSHLYQVIYFFTGGQMRKKHFTVYWITLLQAETPWSSRLPISSEHFLVNRQDHNKLNLYLCRWLPAYHPRSHHQSHHFFVRHWGWRAGGTPGSPAPTVQGEASSEYWWQVRHWASPLSVLAGSSSCSPPWPSASSCRPVPPPPQQRSQHWPYSCPATSSSSYLSIKH